MNENKKPIEDLEQELAILDHKRIEIASKIFSLKLKSAVAQKIKEYEQEDEDDLELLLTLKE
jgi:hypothetical protein